jgi:pyroglutamyl-peptidase
MRALVTGFDPFGGDAVNAAGEAVRGLPPRTGEIDIATAILPTSYARSAAALEAAIARTRPRIVLCVGQAGERGALSIERVAINVQDAAQPDNDGAQPVDQPVAAGAPAAYFSTLPVKEALAALRAAAIPAEVSSSAGTFVCNHVFYCLMRLAACRRHRFQAGFLHVPRIAGQAPSGSGPAMTTESVVRGIELILRVSAASVRAGA